MLGGVVYDLAGWVKEGANGKWMSLSGKPKEKASKKDPMDDLDSDCPF
jgi:hypothetical protein